MRIEITGPDTEGWWHVHQWYVTADQEWPDETDTTRHRGTVPVIVARMLGEASS